MEIIYVTRKMKKEKQIYISVLNILACFGVVMMHCNCVFWTRPLGWKWISANFIEASFYFAVAVFFMISGVTLLDYSERYSTKDYFIKRFKKAVFPFLVWSSIAFVYQTVLAFRHGETPDLNIIHVIDNIINARYMSVYWFFIPLFSVYLSIPVLAKVQDKVNTYQYAVILGFIFTSALPLILNILSLGYNTTFIPGVVCGHLYLTLLGYLLAKMELSKKQRYVIYVLAILGWSAQFFGTGMLSDTEEVFTLFKGDYNLPTVLQAMGVFVFIRYNAVFLNKAETVINWLAKRTFGIYLIHMYLITYLPKIFSIETEGILWRTIGAAGVFLLGAIIIWIMQKIPGIRKIVP